MEAQNTNMHCRISPGRTCNLSGFTMEIRSTYHMLLVCDIKRNSKIDGMGDFNSLCGDTGSLKLKLW